MRVMESDTALPSTSELVSFLKSPSTYDPAPDRVDVIETHAAYVFLAGAFAYKMKKPVDLGYLDFSSLEKRRIDSEREIRLNKRTAPETYLHVAAVTRDAAGRLSLQGEGEGDVVEWLVVMRRFDTDLILDALTERQGAQVLTPVLLSDLARHIAALHDSADPTPDKGGGTAMRTIVLSNDDHLRMFPQVFSDPKAIANFTSQSLRFVYQTSPLLEARRTAGFVRFCHGDMHLGNIVLLDNKPTLFDCIEFSDAFAAIDVLYDLAFLLMDLIDRGLVADAHRLLNAYLMAMTWSDLEEHIQGLALLPLFLSCRAAVRAHVTARMLYNQTLSEGAKGRLTEQAHQYFDLAQAMILPTAPQIVAIGGLSGTGKSTLAFRLAPHIGPLPGAVILRSDEIRKKILGSDPLTPLSEDAYTPEVTAQVYAKQLDLATLAIRAGHAVILDAVFARKEERLAASQCAKTLRVPFQGLWLDAPIETLKDRVTSRTGDVSDADAAVVDLQSTYDVGTITWSVLDASRSLDSLEKAALALC